MKTINRNTSYTRISLPLCGCFIVRCDERVVRDN